MIFAGQKSPVTSSLLYLILHTRTLCVYFYIHTAGVLEWGC